MSAKTIVTGISGWLVVKSVLNLLLGFSFGNLVAVAIAVVIGIVLLAGVPYANYVVSAFLAIVVLKNLPFNIMFFQIIYLLEGVIDVGCILLLCLGKGMKEHFSR